MTEKTKKSLLSRFIRIFNWTMAVVLLLALVIVILHWQTNVVSDRIERTLNSVLKNQGSIEYKELKGNLFSNIRINDLEAELEPGMNIRASQVDVKYNPVLLIFGRIKVSHIYIDQLSFSMASQPDTVREEQVSEKSLPPDSMLAAVQQNSMIDSLLAAMPDLDIKDIRITARSILIKEQPLKFENTELFIDKLQLNKEKYDIRLKNLSTLWKEKNFRLKKLTFKLKGNKEKLTLNQTEIETEYSKIVLNAFLRFKDSLDINLNIGELDLDFNDIFTLTEIDTLRKGALRGTLTASGSPERFNLETDLRGFWHEKQLDSLKADIAYDKGDIKVNHFSAAVNGADLTVDADIKKLKKGSLQIGFKNIDISDFDPSVPESDLSGTVDFNVKNLNLARASGRGVFTLHDSHIDSIPIKALNFDMAAKRGNFQIQPGSFLQLTENSRFNLEGTLSRKRQIDWVLSTFDNDLGEIGKIFGVDSLQGRFEGQFHAMGHLFDPDISGNLWLPHFKFQEIDLDSISLQMFTQNILSSRNGEAEFEIKRGSYGNFPLTKMQVNAAINGDFIDVSKIQFLSKENYLEAAVNVSLFDKTTQIDLPYFRASYEKYWLQNNDTLSFDIDSSSVTISRFQLTGPKASGIEFAGFYDLEAGDLQSYVTFDKFKIDPFQQFWESKFELQGLIDGTLEIITPLTDSNLELDITLDSLRYNGVNLGRVHGEFQYANEKLYFQELNLIKGSSYFHAGGDLSFSLKKDEIEAGNLLEDSQVDLTLEWKDVSLAGYNSLLKLPNRISGFTSGIVSIRGQAVRPELEQYITLNGFKYDQFIADSVELFTAYDNGYFRIDSLKGVLNDTRLAADGWYKYDLDLNNIDTLFLDKPFRINLYSKDDEIRFIGFLNEQIEYITGDYEMELNIGGTPNKPALTSGLIQLNKGEILLSRVRDPLKKVQFEAEITDSVMTFNRCTAVSAKEKNWLDKGIYFFQRMIPWSKSAKNDGKLEVSGNIDFSDLLRPDINLDIKTNKFYADYYIENAAVVLNTDNLSVSGQDTLFITGDVSIPEGVYEVDISNMMQNVYLTESTVTLTPPYPAIIMDINLPGNFVITSSPLDLVNNFKISIAGDMQAIMEAGSDEMQISGHLEVESGKYNAWNQNFNVQSGTIDFRNPVEINPDIEITAVKKIDDRLFELIVSGSLEDMKQDIRVTDDKGQELQMSYIDKISLLTLGADLTQLTTETGAALRGVGEEVATTTALTAVQRGAEKVTGLDKVEISSSSTLLDLEKMKLNNGLEDASISFGKYLTNDLYIEYRTQFGGNVPAPKLSWGAGNQIGLQYRISRLWSFDSYYEKTDKGNNKIRIGLNWELTF